LQKQIFFLTFVIKKNHVNCDNYKEDIILENKHNGNKKGTNKKNENKKESKNIQDNYKKGTIK